MSFDAVLCFSHLRWGFVYQRPNHLMERAARAARVYYVEEPVFDAAHAHLERDAVAAGIVRVVPHLPPGEPRPEASVQALLHALCQQQGITRALHWHYTPMLLPASLGLPRELVVYDCMDELSSFLFAPPELAERERRLLDEADVVFTGGRSLYEAKRSRHPNVHAFPSSVDVAHFEQARAPLPPPADQARIARPRIGYCGVIDERMDRALIAGLARRRPDWQLIMLGPVVKIDPAELPRAPNIHYLGLKTYQELPAYLAGWDCAVLPFARNEATRHISPTKTPEYLAAGKPVVSTSIRDVVEPYGRLGLVQIADEEGAFEAALERALGPRDPERDARRDALLGGMSWDDTWQRMQRVIQQALVRRGRETASREHV